MVLPRVSIGPEGEAIARSQGRYCLESERPRASVAAPGHGWGRISGIVGGVREVEAAGGVVWRVGAGGAVEVVLVHRPRYDDWSFPKGKLAPGEAFEHAARREVDEETGLECHLGAELPPVRYVDGRGRPKVVRYWVMTVERARARVPDDEVDEVRWVPVEQARERLTYPHDRALLDAFAARPPAP